MNWTDERVELLKKLWAEGFSASQIAVQLTGVTRNAVIGKAHRLKLAGRTKAQPRMRKTTIAGSAAVEAAVPETGVHKARIAPPQGRQVANRAVQAGGSKSRRRSAGGTAIIGATALKLDFVEDAVAAQQQHLRPQENVVITMARRLSLMQLTEHTCKWPVGDPLSEGFYFCGADSDESGPYCPCHAKLAFNSSSVKKKN